MRKSGITFRRHSGERGQTILLVAVSLVALLGMAALAIDVVTLYVARSEMQRAADAAALAGAKAFVDSGVTSDPTSPARQLLAQTMATTVINSILPQNKVSGAPPVLVAGSPTFAFGPPGTANPHLTVTLQRTDLPTFFARIWGSRLATVTASAVAEAYNPAGAPANYPPIAPKGVKPLLVPNLDPNRGGAPYIPTVATGVVAPGVVGEGPFTLADGCPNGAATCGLPVVLPSPSTGNYYLPAVVTPNPANLCPSCLGVSDFEHSVECCDFNLYSCGGATPNVTVDTLMSGNSSRQDVHNGMQCLLHSPSADTIVVDDLLAGTGPAKITANSGPKLGNLVTTSSSIAILPIFDPASLNAAGQVTIVGFMQAFIAGSNGSGDITGVTILNVVGCGSNPGPPPPVLGGGYSPIPVRLIHQ